jgi:hypothetical protein
MRSLISLEVLAADDPRPFDVLAVADDGTVWGGLFARAPGEPHAEGFDARFDWFPLNGPPDGSGRPHEHRTAADKIADAVASTSVLWRHVCGYTQPGTAAVTPGECDLCREAGNWTLVQGRAFGGRGA